MKKVLFFAAAAAMMTACSNTDELTGLQVQENNQQTPIAFDVYAGKTITRAGLPGGKYTEGTQVYYGITNKSITAGSHAEAGFGVFGYYTNNDHFDTNSSIPNFMYNQPVVYDGTISTPAWTYEPAKYWPNEFGNSAQSDDVDYLSFFAYAPFVDVTYNTGIPVAKRLAGADAGAVAADPENLILDADALKLIGAPEDNFADWKAANYATATEDEARAALQTKLDEQLQKFNITQLNKNTQTGDPIVKYVVDTKPATSVDLLWGVAQHENGYKGENGEVITEGNPYVDLTKQDDVTKKIKWYFKHALAQINVQIVQANDAVTAATYDPANSSKIGTEGDGTVEAKKLSGVFVRSITFNGFAMKGALNLHSEPVPATGTVANAKPNWLAYDGTNEIQFEPVTFHDGLKDGKEGTTNNIQKGEGTCVLNPELIQKTSVADAGELANQGIPTDAYINLFDGANGDETAPIYVIPSGEPLDITINYDVETIDENLAGLLSDNINHGSAINNVITKTDILKSLPIKTIEPGYSYTIKIIVGLESVKFDVDVTKYEVVADSEIDLPANH